MHKYLLLSPGYFVVFESVAACGYATWYSKYEYNVWVDQNSEFITT